MTASRLWGFGLIVAGILSLLTLLPMGALEVFEFKTVDVRFWVREKLRPAAARQFVRVVELPPVETASEREALLAELLERPLLEDLRTQGAPLIWVLPVSCDPLLLELTPSVVSPRPGPNTIAQAMLCGGPQQLDLDVDSDGVVRRVPLFVSGDSGQQPSLVLRAVCAREGVALHDVHVRPGQVELWRQGRVLRRIPTDDASRVLVNFANRPAGSIWSVPEVATRLAQDQPGLRRDLAGQLVLLGWDARGRRDGLAIPLARVAADLEVVAEATETILAERWVHRPATGLVFLLTWMLLFLGSQLMMRLTSWRAILAGLGLMLFYLVLANAVFIGAGVWLDLIRPMLAFQLAVVIFPVSAFRARSHRLFDQMRLLRRFDDLVLMNVAKGLLVAGRHGMVVRHNPHAAELLGLAGQSLHGRHIRELLAVSPAMLELVGRAMAAGEELDTNVTRKLPISTRVSLPEGDQERVLELEVALVDPKMLHTLEEEDLPCYVLTFDDVTREVTRAKEEAQRARLAAVGEIAAKLGHEIRNSLGGLRLYVDHIREDGVASAAAERALDGMVLEIQTLYRKIDELRQYGSDPKLHREQCDLKELMQEAIHYAHRRLGEKNVTAVIDCERSFPPLWVDRHQLREAFLNLINNAIDAAPAGGRVEIRCDCQGTEAGDSGLFHIHVEDNGPGIPVDIEDQIFSLFFTTKEDTGTGLGLPMVRKIIESHGGSVSFESREEGGTRFTVVLPTVPAMKEVES